MKLIKALLNTLVVVKILMFLYWMCKMDSPTDSGGVSASPTMNLTAHH